MLNHSFDEVSFLCERYVGVFSFQVACIQNFQVCVNFFREVFKYIYCSLHCIKIKYATLSDMYATFSIYQYMVMLSGWRMTVHFTYTFIVAYHDY
jgi:hypothetical protein